jgi:ubiquinone/menaquinone biosynthesis C-methylase UbiE
VTRGLELNEVERLTAVVYGDTFALYDEPAFDEFLAPLYRRLRANNIDLSVFRGKTCLDAGCGGGRGSVLMAQSGAERVIGVDLSPVNVESARKRAAQKGCANVSFEQHSLAALPFKDETFDVVWCNGVLHHSEHPDVGLLEITRVLKTGGHLWLYLYGSGGIYWHVVDWIRDILADVDVRRCIYTLRLMGTPVRRIGEWIDDWFVPHLRRYTVADVTSRLDELGYEDTAVLRFGVEYDTSHRRVNADPGEKALMGDGDVRHFCRKSGRPTGHRHALPDPPDGKGSPYVDDEVVMHFDEALARIAQVLNDLFARRPKECDVYRILVCRSVHSHVRSLLESKSRFDTTSLSQHLSDLEVVLQGVAGTLTR